MINSNAAKNIMFPINDLKLNLIGHPIPITKKVYIFLNILYLCFSFYY